MSVDETCNAPFAIGMARAVTIYRQNLGPQEQRLLPLIVRHRKFEATDPRDKIFGLFGLFPPSKYTHPLLLAPNYESSIVEVYCKAAKCILDQDQSLDLLAVPRSQSTAAAAFLKNALEIPGWAFSDPPRIPSWVPIWYTDDENVVCLRPGLLYYEASTFKATGTSKYELKLSPDHAFLGVDGFSISAVSSAGIIWARLPKDSSTSGEPTARYTPGTQENAAEA
jgi:hypothetical protein